MTQAAALAAQQKLRNVPPRDIPESEELRVYVEAITAHGAALADEMYARLSAEWDAAGVSDEKILDAFERKAAHLSSKAEVDAKVESLIAEEERLKELHPDWLTDPEARQKVHDAGMVWATMMDEYTNTLTAIGKELFQANATRIRLFRENIVTTLAQERELGGEASLSDNMKLSKADAEMMGDVLSRFPSDMISYANGRGVPLYAKRSKVRAHYAGASRQKKKSYRAGVLNAANALIGEPFWDANQDFVNLRGEPLEDRHVSHRETVEDTEENRAILGERIAEFKKRKGRISANKVPRIQEVVFDGQRRLALYVPDGWSEFTTKESPLVGELTFNGESSMTHEFGHHFETSNPEVGMACKLFLQRRTEGFEKSVYAPATRSKPAEIVISDGFMDSYIGKDYPGNYNTEVFSMGVEALLAGAHGGLMGVEVDMSRLGKEKGVPKTYRADPEHFALVMGLLSIANRGHAANVDRDESDA